RSADVLGAGETGFAYLAEPDAMSPSTAGVSDNRTLRWRSYDGRSDAVVPRDADMVLLENATWAVGDRLVHWTGGATVRTWVPGAAGWTPLAVGGPVVGVTGDGVLVADG